MSPKGPVRYSSHTMACGKGRRDQIGHAARWAPPAPGPRRPLGPAVPTLEPAHLSRNSRSSRRPASRSAVRFTRPELRCAAMAAPPAHVTAGGDAGRGRAAAQSAGRGRGAGGDTPGNRHRPCVLAAVCHVCHVCVSFIMCDHVCRARDSDRRHQGIASPCAGHR